MIDYSEFDTENDRLIYKTSQIAEVAMGKMTISLLLWLCCCLPLEAAALRIAVNDAPPYRIVNPPFFGGYYIELIQAAGKLAGLELQFIGVPLKRAFQMLENGEADLILGPNRTPEREQFLLFLDNASFPAEDKVFIVARPEMVIHALSDLQGKRIDVLAGAAYHPDIDRAGLLNKHELNSYSQGLQRLLRNRSDLVIIPEAQADYLLRELKLSLIKSPFHLRGTPSYLAWSRRTYDAPTALKLATGLQQVLEGVQGKTIRARYFR